MTEQEAQQVNDWANKMAPVCLGRMVLDLPRVATGELDDSVPQEAALENLLREVRPEFRKDAPRGEGPPNPERILANLKLDPEKRKKVEDILFAQQQRMREFMEKNRNASPEERQNLFPQIREMQEGMMKAMREILSEEQLRDLRNQMPGFPGRPNATFNKGN